MEGINVARNVARNTAGGVTSGVSGVLSYVTGPGLIAQILLAILVILALYSLITVVENIVDAVTRFDRQSAVLFGDTTPAQQVIVQSPNSGVPLIYNSMNEQNGMEFSYSAYIFISPETFEGFSKDSCGAGSKTDITRLKHIFHKGGKDPFPLLAPGLFVEGSKNTLRLYMNSATKWDNYVEIPNVPVGKWFHLVITLKGKYLDVYVNGNVTVRHEFDVVPKLNYGNVYVMFPAKYPKNPTDRINTTFSVDGAMKGMVSRLKYYAFALNYSQIDSLYREGPSKTIVSQSYSEVPPYFHDDWWVTRY
jgi:hypothetical protein